MFSEVRDGDFRAGCKGRLRSGFGVLKLKSKFWICLYQSFLMIFTVIRSHL